MLSLNLSWAAESKPGWVNVYQSSVFEFPGPGSNYETVTAGRHPWLVGYFLNNLVSWDPQDTLAPLPQDCSAKDLQKDLTQSLTAETYNKAFQDYAKKCESKYVQAYRPPFLGLLGLFAMKYSLDENPFLRRTVIHLPNGQKLKAALALKDQKKRPFVIVRMGITGNVEEAYAERFFYHHLFERGFYHLLLVENLTSSDFLYNNKVMDFGGVSEAYQNIWIAERLRSKEEKISELVESVHLIGLSLGGQGVLASAWIAPAQPQKNTVQSYLGLCPLVDLKKTFNQLFIKNSLKYPLEFWARSRFSEIQNFRSDLYTYDFGLTQRLLEASQQSFKKPAVEYGLLEPEFMKASNDFYFLHDLTQWDPEAREDVRAWVTAQDQIVPLELNSNNLDHLQPLVIAQGQHCSFPVEWHPHVTQALFNSHLLQNSKLQLEEISLQIQNISEPGWEFENVISGSEDSLQLILKSGNREEKLKVERSQLDFKIPNGPIDVFTLSVLKKWFSTNLKIHVDTVKSQMTVSWPFVRN